MAIVEIVGNLIRHLAISEDYEAGTKKKQIESFWELLMARFLDVNSWVRTKVVQTVIKLLE
jgi:condensin complex subunit 1